MHEVRDMKKKIGTAWEEGRHREQGGRGNSRKKDYICRSIFRSGTYKEIFGGGAAAYIQLLLLRYQHVLTYPYQQWVVHSPLSPWRLERAQPQR